MTPRLFAPKVLLFLIAALCHGTSALAQQAKTSSLEDLAKAAQTPNDAALGEDTTRSFRN